MTTKTKEIRRAIKEAGYTNRQISLKENASSLNWSYDITIKDDNVNIDSIKEIATKFQSIDRDHSTGEILNGANTYISITNKNGIIF